MEQNVVNNYTINDVRNFSNQNHSTIKNNYPIITNVPLPRTRCVARKRATIPKYYRCYRTSPIKQININGLVCKKSIPDEQIAEERPFNNNNIENSNCFVCNWNFPPEMTVQERETHINLCLDGNGEKHREDYMKSREIVEMTLHAEEYERSRCVCPFCNKRFSSQGIEKHKEKCAKQFAV